MPEELPLAHITKAVVLAEDRNLILYAEGRAPGGGGKLQFARSPDRMLPPGFEVRAVAGNMGTNPDRDFSMNVSGAAVFHGAAQLDEYRIIHAGGVDTVSVVRTEQPPSA